MASVLRNFMIGLVVLASVSMLHAQTPGESRSVRCWAEVQSGPPMITVKWQGFTGTTGYQLFRKLKGGSSWGSAIAAPSSGALEYADNGVAVGTSYEYKVVRTTSGQGNGYGYVNASIALPMVEQRGKLVVLVDNTFTVPLAAQIAQAMSDLEGDGWGVVRYDVSRTAPVTSIKALVVNAYNVDPQSVKAVFILGHVPVPYSGNLAPDGHSNHYGAWSADVYYGDVNGTWTDNTVNSTGATGTRNDNVPGDGKFDQTVIPSSVELAVGRVDFYDLPAFSQNETVLLGNYLSKLHQWKVKQITAQARGLVHDNFTSYADGFSQNGWRGFSPLVHPNNVSAGNYFSAMANQSYIWSYGCGPGWWDNALGIGSTQQFATSNLQSIFTILFGSYLGDWDSQNNFLRAALASGTTLSNFWAGYPNWYFHHMGLGETIGYAAVLTQNNTGHYEPANWQANRVHIALMGDPTLRMHMVAPPTNVQITSPTGATTLLTWTASAEASLLGYHVYRKNGQVWERRTTSPITATSFSDNTAGLDGTIRYMARALKLENVPSGSYQNLSLGAQGEVSIVGAATDCLGVVDGPAVPGTPCNDGNACTYNDVWTENCICVGIVLQCADADPCSLGSCVNGICVQTPVPDSDGDGVCNTLDGCPMDPNKVAPGSCGCGNSEPGTACDDGNLLTIDDSIGLDCICSGLIVDCNGVPGGGAVFDNCGVCGGNNDCIVASTCFTLGDTFNPDGEEAENGNIYNNEGSLDLVLDGSPDPWRGNQVVALRFNNITVPSQAPIVNAYVQFTARPGNGNNADPCSLEVTMQAADDAPPLGFEPFNYSSRSRTEAVSWSPPAWAQPNEAMEAQRTPNLASIVQEVVDRPGWQENNSVVVLLEGVGRRAAYSRDQSQSRSARLCISHGSPPLDCNGVAGGAAQPGSPCDDGDETTGADAWSFDCECAGFPLDCAGIPDGNAQPGMPCDDGDPGTGDDVWSGSCVCVGIPLDCEGVVGGPSMPGTPCDDGMVLTINDVFDDACQCSGTETTMDCLGVEFGGALPGTPCDDGDASTGGDSWNDQCTCIGLPLDCEGEPGGNSGPGSPCDDGDPLTGDDQWTTDCECEGALIDCMGVSGGNALPNTPCDDGDFTTGDDAWTVDCLCAGLALDCLGIPGGASVIGSDCDDGDPLTVDDQYAVDCICSGSVPDCLGIPGGGAMPGSPCDDGIDGTGNDQWTIECNCVGQPLDCLGIAGGTATPGSSCDDGDLGTGDDVWGEACICAGFPIDCQGIPGGTALPGSACDDGSALTGNDEWTLGCQCIGQLIDCTGEVGGTALPFTICNDGDPSTVLDTWNIECECQGILVDCAGVLGGSAFIDACGDCTAGSTGLLPNPDVDADGFLDCFDNCIDDFDPSQADFDGDGVGDLCDNCPWLFNPEQTDSNNNQVGDPCDEVGIHEHNGVPVLPVHPNPTNSILYIEMDDPMASKIIVHDLLGSVVLVRSFERALDLTILAQGAYVLTVMELTGRPLARARVVKF